MLKQQSHSFPTDERQPEIKISNNQTGKPALSTNVLPLKNEASSVKLSSAEKQKEPSLQSNNHEPSLSLTKEKGADNSLWGNESNTQPSYQEKVEIVNALGTNLDSKKISEIYDYLETGPEGNAYDLHIKDLLLIKLEAQTDGFDLYLDNLRHMISDQNLSGEFRGYALQHLSSAYRKVPGRREELRAFIFENFNEADSDVSGTSLLAAVGLSEEFPDFDQAAIMEGVLSLVDNKDSHHPSRITAVSLAGQLNVKKALPSLRTLATKGEDVTMQVAAISSLGKIGENYDVKLLKAMVTRDNNPFVLNAAKQALRKLEVSL